jgi:Xaa-Pro dipeptidase
MQITAIQDALRQEGLDGWLFFDHHRRDPLAYRILSIPASIEATRRWYYFVPAEGEPRKLVHQIEKGALDSLPGSRQVYSSWVDQRNRLTGLVGSAKRIAMQYSPNCSIPYVSLVDAGTMELVRATGVEVVSSANLVQEFEARWSAEQLAMHLEAGKLVDQIRREAFELIGQRLRSLDPVDEYEVQQFIRHRFQHSGLETDHGPIVAVNANASDPHYEPASDRTAHIQKGDFVLIDLWAKLAEPQAVYYDVTWTGYCGEQIPAQICNVFEVVKTARRRATDFAIQRARARQVFAGFEVDDVCREYITEQGYGESFFHRTGHSIGTEVHGTGANMDNLESHDERRVIADTCFSVEPGVYLAEFGVRSEVNVYVSDGDARVTGEEQEQLIQI